MRESIFWQYWWAALAAIVSVALMIMAFITESPLMAGLDVILAIINVTVFGVRVINIVDARHRNGGENKGDVK